MGKNIFIASIIFLLSSCVGHRYSTIIKKNEVVEFVKENDIDINSVYILDSAYKEYIFSTTDSIIGRKILQPMQTICFDRNDSVVAFNANCFAHLRYLTFNLQWNYEGVYDEFPPRNNIFNFNANGATSPDKIFNHSKLLGKKEREDKNAKYKIFIFCGLKLARQSSYLIEEVKRMLEGVDQNDYQTYYIISDNMYRYRIIE